MSEVGRLPVTAYTTVPSLARPPGAQIPASSTIVAQPAGAAVLARPRPDRLGDVLEQRPAVTEQILKLARPGVARPHQHEHPAAIAARAVQEWLDGIAAQVRVDGQRVGVPDGPAHLARLQHPLGVAFDNGVLYVADTYNNKIKTIDPVTGASETLVGMLKPGRGDDPPQFDEPAGISAAAGKLYVADTNNHLVRVVNLSDNRVSTLSIPGLEPPKPAAEPGADRPRAGAAQERLKPVSVRPDRGAIRLAVDLVLPEGFKINPLAPTSYRVQAADGDGIPAAGVIRRDGLGKSTRLDKPSTRFEITLPLASSSGEDTLSVTLNYYYCREGAEGICKLGTVVWIVPVKVSAEAIPGAVPLRHRVR